MPYEIKPWADIRDHYSGGNILLGNGASIAVSDSFRYDSLLDHARQNGLFTDDIARLFDFFKTQDFELVLRLVWQATNVNKSLNIPDARTHAAYTSLRESIIKTVQAVHPEYGKLVPFFPRVAKFLRQFETVISLNYDLIVYWSALWGNNEFKTHSFKDCFKYGLFSDDWQEFRNPIFPKDRVSLIFYPHGNLTLCRNRIEEEIKISAPPMRPKRNRPSYLSTILGRWLSADVVPLFVSEGTPEQKMASIHNSYYLSTVYREVIPSLSGPLVVYGWGVWEQDIHLLNRLAKANIERIAVSVRLRDQAYCNRVFHVLRDTLGDIPVEFFNRDSPGCWVHPER
jgi:hypothetical protein